MLTAGKRGFYLKLNQACMFADNTGEKKFRGIHAPAITTKVAEAEKMMRREGIRWLDSCSKPNEVRF